MTARRATLLLVAALIVGSGLFAAPAQAAFPGANGKIAFTLNVGGNYEIYTINADGTNQTRLTNNPASDSFPAWSPDGTKIAFVSSRDEPNPSGCAVCNLEIYTMNADGTNQTRLTNNPADDRYPAWSPDGTRIAFLSSRISYWDIYVMNADGTNQTRLAANAQSPAWSPDGGKIAFETNRDGPNEIYSMNADGTGETRLTNNFVLDEQPNWSPDGQKILFTEDLTGEGDSDIIVMNADGSNQRDITHVAGNNAGWVHAAWSPDGRKIVAHREQIYVVNPQCCQWTPLTQGFFPDWQQIPSASYPHPQSALSLQASLVPTFRPCGTGANPTNGQHSPPLGTQSCLPPVPGSNVARVGATSTGMASFTVVPGDTDPTNGDQANVNLSASLTDVKTPGGADYTPNATGPDLTEITRLRLTDKANNYGGASGTATEYDFRVPLECTATSDPAIGATCSTATSADALLPGFVTEQRQTVVQAFRVRVDDAGANGTTGDSDDRIFATQGIYIP